MHKLACLRRHLAQAFLDKSSFFQEHLSLVGRRGGGGENFAKIINNKKKKK